MGTQRLRQSNPDHSARDGKQSPSAAPAPTETAHELGVAADSLAAVYYTVLTDLAIGAGHDYAKVTSRPQEHVYATLDPCEVPVGLNSANVFRSPRDDVRPSLSGNQDQQLAVLFYEVASASDGDHLVEVDGSTSDEMRGFA